MVTQKLDAKIEKWKKRPLKHLTEEQLQELVEDLREETVVLQSTKRKIMSESYIKRVMFGVKKKA